MEVPTVQWHWNSDEQVAVPPGISCFVAGNEYAHGGLSLQECLIPIMRVTAEKATAKASLKINYVNWAGLRCRVQIEGAQLGLSVDLRTKVNDPESSVAATMSVDGDGAASLLVTDDELEGTTVVLVVLDASNHVITNHPTIIGGDD